MVQVICYSIFIPGGAPCEPANQSFNYELKPKTLAG